MKVQFFTYVIKYEASKNITQLSNLLLQYFFGINPRPIAANWLKINSRSQKNALSINPYECRPTPSMFTPNHEKLVRIFPKIVQSINPRILIIPDNLACKMIAFHSTIISAPFSFGSHPQNLPHDWSAQMPPKMVPIKLNNRLKQTIP